MKYYYQVCLCCDGRNENPVTFGFGKHSGVLIVFIYLDDPMTNYANIQEEDIVASHALAFLVRGFMYGLEAYHWLLLHW